MLDLSSKFKEVPLLKFKKDVCALCFKSTHWFYTVWTFNPIYKNCDGNLILPQPEHFISVTSHHHPVLELYIVPLIIWTKFVCRVLSLSHSKWVSCALLLSCLCILWGLLGRSGPVLCVVFTCVMKLMQMLFSFQLYTCKTNKWEGGRR